MTSTHMKRSNHPTAYHLPEGKTCGDCFHLENCAATYGKQAGDEVCEHGAPTMFTPATEPVAEDPWTLPDFLLALLFVAILAVLFLEGQTP